MIILSGVEMGGFDVAVSANPYNGNAQPQSETGFKIDPRPVMCKISNHEAALANISDDSVVDLFIVLSLIDAQRYVTSLNEGGFLFLPCKLIGD